MTEWRASGSAYKWNSGFVFLLLCQFISNENQAQPVVLSIYPDYYFNFIQFGI